MSFLNEMLEAAGNFEKEESSVHFQKILARADELKVEFHTALKENYENFNLQYSSAEDVDSRLEELLKDWDAFSSRSNQVLSSLQNLSEDYKNVADQIDETNLVIENLAKLKRVSSLFESLDEASFSKNYTKSTEVLQDIEMTINSFVTDGLDNIKVLHCVGEKFQFMKNRLISDIIEAYNKVIKWNLPVASTTGAAKGEHIAKLTLPNTPEAIEETQRILQALNNLGILQTQLKGFTDRFFQYFLKPVVSYSQCKFSAKEGSEAIMTIVYTVPAAQKGQVEMDPKETCGLLRKILKIVHKHFLSYVVNQADGDFTLMSVVGSLCSSKTLEMFTANCLMHAIPTNFDKLDEFHGVMKEVESFRGLLVSLGFIGEKDNTLPDFVTNVNVIFANKKCQQILVKGRSLMQSDMYRTVLVGSKIASGSTGLSVTDSPVRPPTDEEVIGTVHLQFPQCYISAWAEELVKLAYETLREAASTVQQCATQLFYAVHSIFQMFLNIVTVCHKEDIEKVPQITALHHNNCMYIAHYLMTLGPQFQSKLPEPLSHGAALLVDLVPQIRKLGSEVFLAQMKKQKEQLLEILKGAQDFSSVSLNDNSLKVEKSFKQILLTLVHLKTVWSGVLPNAVYFKAIGALLNGVLAEVVTLVVGLEDISADDAVQLHMLLSLLSDKGPELFTVADSTDPPEALLQHHVKQWNKLKDLKMILNASLLEISDNWADGKGGLTKNFTAMEVKQLIRALFQNTDRRAAILARIK